MMYKQSNNLFLPLMNTQDFENKTEVERSEIPTLREPMTEAQRPETEVRHLDTSVSLVVEDTSVEQSLISHPISHISGCTCEGHTTNHARMQTAAAVAGLTATALLASCKKEEDLLFEVNTVGLYSSAAEKDKMKSNEQYVSILYTNLFQQAISSSDVFSIANCFDSIGDQELAREVLISNFFNDDGVQLPTIEEMNADIETFIVDTFKRFFVRIPTEAEKTWVKNFITSNPYMTPELVYFSFALTNEYLFY